MNTIMIVEDDMKIAELLGAHIKKYGYQSVIIEGFENILEIFQEIKPDIVLLDVNFPNFEDSMDTATSNLLFISRTTAEKMYKKGLIRERDNNKGAPIFRPS